MSEKLAELGRQLDEAQSREDLLAIIRQFDDLENEGERETMADQVVGFAVRVLRIDPQDLVEDS